MEAELEGDAIDDPLGLGDEDPYSRLDSAVVVDAAKQHLAERARRAEQWSRLSMEERLEAGPEDSDAAPPPRSVFNASGARRRGYRLQDSLLESTRTCLAVRLAWMVMSSWKRASISPVPGSKPGMRSRR